MKTRFVQIYLFCVAVVLLLTAIAKLPAFLMGMATLCMEEPMFDSWQPQWVPNELILMVAAGIELSIVALIRSRRPRWVPCLAAASWGTVCVAARVYFSMAGTDCGCLGWLAKPGPTTNLIVGSLALVICIGGWIAFEISRHESESFHPRNRTALP
jgi:peptidoglycan/LPS O-acetylase OafA/YrhL